MASVQLSNDSRPLYARIAEVLQREIRQQKPGKLLATQAELAERFDTSLITVKRALDELRRLGIIESIRGKGTIVRRPNITDARTGVSSWTDTMLGLGSEPKTAWNRIDIEAGSAETRRVLNLKQREKLLVVRRLRTIDGEPICLMTNELPASLVPGLAESGLSEESLYSVLGKRYGIRFAYADEQVSARRATSDEVDVFGDQCDTVIEVRRISFDADGQAVESGWLTAPIDRYTYCVRVESDQSRPKRKRKTR